MSLFFSKKKKKIERFSHRNELYIILSANVHFSGEEPQVIDYQTQQEKLFPVLASAYAMTFTGEMILKEYMRINADMEKGILDEMAAVNF